MSKSTDSKPTNRKTISYEEAQENILKNQQKMEKKFQEQDDTESTNTQNLEKISVTKPTTNKKIISLEEVQKSMQQSQLLNEKKSKNEELKEEYYTTKKTEFFDIFKTYTQDRYNVVNNKLETRNLSNTNDIAEKINNCINKYGGENDKEIAVNLFQNDLLKYTMEKPIQKASEGKENLTIADVIFDEQFPKVLQEAAQKNPGYEDKLNKVADNFKKNQQEMIKKAYKASKSYINEKPIIDDYTKDKKDKEIEALNNKYEEIIDDKFKEKIDVKDQLKKELMPESFFDIKDTIVNEIRAKNETITIKDIKAAVNQKAQELNLTEKDEKDFTKHMTKALKNDIKDTFPKKYKEGILSKISSKIKGLVTNRSMKRTDKVTKNIENLNESLKGKQKGITY